MVNVELFVTRHIVKDEIALPHKLVELLADGSLSLIAKPEVTGSTNSVKDAPGAPSDYC
jgi:hypothetical protein